MDRGALEKLIAAVEAGTLPEAVFHGCSAYRGHWAYLTGLNSEQRRWVYSAYNGSIDAAKALHEALLPGSDWSIDNLGRGREFCAQVYDGVLSIDAFNANPARAWLLAQLKAKLVELSYES